MNYHRVFYNLQLASDFSGWPIAYGNTTGAVSRTAEKQSGGEKARINQDNHDLLF